MQSPADFRSSRYCPAKTNRGRKVYQSRGLSFPLNRRYFIFKINPLTTKEIFFSDRPETFTTACSWNVEYKSWSTQFFLANRLAATILVIFPQFVKIGNFSHNQRLVKNHQFDTIGNFWNTSKISLKTISNHGSCTRGSILVL